LTEAAKTVLTSVFKTTISDWLSIAQGSSCAETKSIRREDAGG